jgi:hypothetical protein
VVGLAAVRLRRRLETVLEEDPEAARLVARVVDRELDPATAAIELLELTNEERG